MGARLTDAAAFAHLWGTDEVRALFDERGRTQRWLDILAALADVQASIGIIPRAAADAIAAHADVELIDLDLVAAETRATAHSTLGLIRAWQRVLPPDAAEHVYYGVTVQDLTDTWMALVMGDLGAVVWRDLRAIEHDVLNLAAAHRSTVMAGRTHGQAGAPITFGLKTASWADEIRRHVERLAAGRDRWLVGQLGGAVGTLGFFGPDGPALRAAFCERLGLADPVVPWLTSRDRVAEFGHLLAMVCATLARVGNEVYELQRTEIGELREASAGPDAIGSITMPHKRNPEASEHLDTLARIARANAGLLLEGMVQVHERDGRGWKAEWAAFPEVALVTSAALRLGRALVGGLEVDAAAMAANIEARRGYLASEAVLAALSPTMGKHRAQAMLQTALAEAQADDRSLVDAVAATGAIDADVAAKLADPPDLTTAERAVDDVVARARRARSSEAEQW
jgi:adenylosuccinate lyase